MVRQRHLNCLVLQLELPDIEKTKAISAFLGLPYVVLSCRNVRAVKDRPGDYERFKARVALPDDVIDAPLASRYPVTSIPRRSGPRSDADGAAQVGLAVDGSDIESLVGEQAVSRVASAAGAPALAAGSDSRLLDMSFRRIWSERPDLNRRPPVPQTDALPGCATLRPRRFPWVPATPQLRDQGTGPIRDQATVAWTASILA